MLGQQFHASSGVLARFDFSEAVNSGWEWIRPAKSKKAKILSEIIMIVVGSVDWM